MIQEQSVIFHVESSQHLENLTFDYDKPNPGCGGTQFCSISVALLVAQANSSLNVKINSKHSLNIANCPTNFSIVSFSSLEELLLKSSENQIIISPINYLIQINKKLLEENKNRIVPWIHHPFNKSLLQLEVKFPFAVAVGTYQYYSNLQLSSSKLIHIQNPYNNIPFHNPKNTKSYKYLGKETKAVYLGSLIPGKGFHLIAQQWSQISQRFPNLTLRVIGSSSTYGNEPTHSLLPCDKKYGDKIMESIPKSDIEKGRIQFLGNLGLEKIDIFHESDVALLNPTGNTEAFPASPLECMAAGLPVIASNDYGMGDSMRFFPDLALSKHQYIVDSLEHLFQDSEIYNYYYQQALSVSHWFANQTQANILRWIELFNALFENRDYRLSPKPLLSFYGSKPKLAWRTSKVYLKQLLGR